MRIEQIGDCTIHPYESMVYLYAIKGESIVYVGSTKQNIKRRLESHIKDSKNGSDLPIHKWMKSRSYKFEVFHLETVPESLRESAEKKWIANFTNLLNLTDGGGGLSGHKFAGSEHAKRIASKLRTGTNFDCVVCGSSFWKKRSEIIKTMGNYCSRKCSNARHKCAKK